jgi:hypothetical protein
MEKNAKNILTRREIGERLVLRARGEALMDGVIFAIVLLVCAPLSALGVYLFPYLPVLSVFVCAICLIPPVVVGVLFTRTAILLGKLRRGEWLVAHDTVAAIARGEAPRALEGRSPKDALYFTRYGRWVVGSTTLGLCSVGDAFIVALSEGKRPHILSAFPAARYEYRQE